MKTPQKAKPGHLAQGGTINSAISEQGRKNLSAKQKARYAAEKVKPVDLGWVRG